jgi:hypothetical protein
LGADFSLGMAQIRLSTAARIDGAPLENLPASEYRDLRSQFLKPEENIAYEARELRVLLDQENRYLCQTWSQSLAARVAPTETESPNQF